MTRKTVIGWFRSDSSGTLGEWAYGSAVERQHTTPHHPSQAAPADTAVYFERGYPERVRVTDLQRLAGYGTTAIDVFLEWRAACRAFAEGLRSGVSRAELRRHLDRLNVVFGRANTLLVPDRAAAIQRVFLAMLQSGKGYYQSLFDDTDEDAIGQYERAYREESTMFLNELDRFLGFVGLSFKVPRDLD